MASVLIVDDDVRVRPMLRMTLERAGYEVHEAANGKIALQKYQHHPCDLVITDIVMPEKEGIETIIELRALYPTVKIIAISGGGKIAPEQYLKLAEHFGVEYSFTKPLDNAKLLDAIGSLIGRPEA